MTTTRTFNDAGQLLGESYSGGTLNGLSVNSTYDAFARRDTLNFKNGATVLGGSTYGYDTASRLASVTDGTNSAMYAYQADSSLVDTITFKTGTTNRMTTQKRFDRLNRLLSIASIPTAANQAIPSFSYQYNDANQRTRTTLGDGSFWIYEYDTLGQVRSGKRYWSDGTPVAGQQFEYSFDDIGNRTNSKRGGDENGANLRETTYSRNFLNQYDSRSNIGSRYVDVMGLATYNQSAPANVTVNGQTAYRRGEFWRSELGLGGSTALWQSVTINVGSTTNSGNLFVPPTPETFTYDLDGNLQTDGRWTYTWDAENRLTAMESLAGNPSNSKRKLAFEYDVNSRRIGKKVYVWNGTAFPGSPNTTLKFVYDGWNLLAELDGSNSVVRSYQWGADLSGSSQGAGGVGGLLSVKLASGIAQFVAFDGNGNVTALLDGSTGAASANYEYDPFGETIRSSGSQSINPIRFSTKYHDSESALIYYGFRFYSPRIGRWPNRDPIGENDGPNIYDFLRDDGLNKIDFLGLKWIIKREGKPRAEAWATSSSDTFDDLARKIRLDTFDYKKWAQTSDGKPDPFKKYSIPSTIYIDLGWIDHWDMVPWTVLSIWRSQANRDKADWESKGFLVPMNDGAIDAEITSHLASPNTHGYVFIGHGADPGIINAYSHLGEDVSGMIPERYTSHGISFLTLKACYSAAKMPTVGKQYIYNAWESNVATRGWFVGYEGSVNTVNESFQWAVARGQNNKP